ncbi:MAG: hypothetical protein MUO58_12140 [Anaerolineales bacterium]|nr:hypothetical protein [Anaerolineales bacterium]
MKTSDNPNFPLYGILGLVIMGIGEILLALDVYIAAVWLTPMMWTGYILAADATLYRRKGSSWLTTRRREFPLVLLLSIGVWLLFEVLNFHIQNWTYHSVPDNPVIRDFAYFWSFATIMPGVFITSDIICTFTPKRFLQNHPIRSDGLFLGAGWLWFLCGLLLIVIPLLLPTAIASYLFGAIWIGFILLIDPINERMGAPSFRRMMRERTYWPILSLLAGGLVCGFLWEAWNFQAFLAGGGHWIYLVPEPLRIFGLHYGKMPLLGMLGFPPFALELFAMYHFLRKILDGDRLLSKPADW